MLVGVAGAPGSGKSTLAEHLAQHVNEQSEPSAGKAVVVPMDGFHLDNIILDRYAKRAVKGSPGTFDAGGFISLVQRLGQERHHSLYAPVFDRAADLARTAAQEIRPEHGIVVIEGNYLLLKREPWCHLKPLFHCSVMLEVPMDELERRLIQRWLDHGYTQEQAAEKAGSNDLPNARLVVEHSANPHLYYKSMR